MTIMEKIEAAMNAHLDRWRVPERVYLGDAELVEYEQLRYPGGRPGVYKTTLQVSVPDKRMGCEIFTHKKEAHDFEVEIIPVKMASYLRVEGG